MVIKIIYNILFGITMLYTLYFTITILIGIIKKNKNVVQEIDNNHFFAILIPARNEEKVISNLLESLNNMNYPKNKYDIYVIPNNCTDKTENVVKKYSVNVIKCDVKTKTKADVLRYTFSKLEDKKEIDAYVIFDADNVVHPDFLINMNNCLNNGYNVAQGYRSAKNPSDTWISGSYAIFYLLQNTFFNYSRTNLNSSPTINGTAFMLRKSYIDKWGFDTKTLTEDMEFSGLCALKNERIAYVENAITYDEHPNNFIPSWYQRKRWSSGMLACMKLYSGKLLKNFFKTGNMASLDMMLMYMSPIFQVVGFINCVVFMIINLIEIDKINTYFITSSIVTILISYIMFILIELFAVCLRKEKLSKVVNGMIFFPLFLTTWIPINIACILKKETEWKVIKHNRSIKINDVLNK